MTLKHRLTRRATVLSTLVLLSACSSSDASGSADAAGEHPGGAGVGQGGAQDFGQFRDILDRGEIPGPATLDDVGFFNEHKLELPPPECDGDICLHGQLGVMGNMITGSNCTLILLGMNTPLDPSTIERPPQHLAIAIDTSHSMEGEPIAFVREGLLRMLDDLQPADRVTLVTFDTTATIVADALDGTDPALRTAIESLRTTGKTNLYAGLRTAYEAVDARRESGLQSRVLLLSDGEATVGLTSDPRVVALAEGWSAEGIGLSTIGTGEGFDPVLMRRLAEVGGGAFYFLEDPAAIREVFEEEVRTFLIPLATDVAIDVQLEDGYALRGVYGTKSFELTNAAAHIDIPSLQIAHRTSDEDNAGGRRGGGGAMVLELVPQRDAGEGPGAVGRVVMTYSAPGNETRITEEVEIMSTVARGATPEQGVFSGAAVEKSFVMVNIFAGFEMAAWRASFGDENGALEVLEALRPNVEAWVADRRDADIEEDLRYIDRFIENLRVRGADQPPAEKPTPEPWPQD